MNMKPNIYIVVDVHYDYHRFQNNIAAFTDILDARQFVWKMGNNTDRRIIVTENEEQSYAMGGKETDHIWIQKIEQK